MLPQTGFEGNADLYLPIDSQDEEPAAAAGHREEAMFRQPSTVIVVRLLLGLCLAVVLVVSSACSSKEEQAETPLNKIPLEVPVVIVDDIEIHGAWLRNWCVTQQLALERQGLPVQVDEYDLIRQGRELLTKMVIVAREARRLGIEVTEQEVQDRLAQEMSRFDSTERWLEILEKSGLTRERRKEQVKLELLFHKYEAEVLGPKVEEDVLTQENLRAYYDRYRDQVFVRPLRVHVRYLMRAVPKDAPEQERQRERKIVEDAYARIKGGEPFEDVARELSAHESALEGGDIGWVTEEVDMPKDLQKAVLELSAGEMTGVLEGPHGFHLFEAIEVREAGPVPFEDVEEEIRARIKEEAMKGRMAEHVSQLREQLIAAGKIKWFNLTPYLGRSLTPKEAQAMQETTPTTAP